MKNPRPRIFIIINDTKYFRCSRCGAWKTRQCYDNDRSTKDSVTWHCKECRRRRYHKRRARAAAATLPAHVAAVESLIVGEIETWQAELSEYERAEVMEGIRNAYRL